MTMRACIDVCGYGGSMGYLGSKAASGAYQAIIALMPPHRTYLEPFVGSGAIVARKPAAARTVLNDADPVVIKSLSPEIVTAAEVYCEDAFNLLARWDWDRSGPTLVYLDPPYLRETRGSARYRYDFSDADHCRLLDLARSLPSTVSIMVSGYPSALYSASLADWWTTTLQVMTRGGPRTEQIWCSFEPGQVHWSSYAGTDFTDRQRIKRKAARWAANYRRLSPGERLAILAALLQVDL